MSKDSLFTELRKRRVVQSAAIYGAVAWGVTEVVVTVVQQLFLPQWVSTLAVIGFVVGFPVAMFLAWTFDITPEGLSRNTISSRRGKASILFSLLLVISGTAGIFFLIKPSLERGPEIATPAGIEPNSIAVLPFESLNLEPENRHLSDILSDELRDQLGRIPGLRIAARSSSIAVLDRAVDAKSVSRQLGVSLLVEGRLRRHGQKLNVSVQLIEGNTGLSLWSEIFERDPHNVLVLQHAITEPIVRLVLPEAEQVVAEPASRDTSANELMLLARHYEQIVRDKQEVDTATLNEAIRLYTEATVADPDSAVAHSRLAGALLYIGDLEAAEAPIFQALTLNPNLSEVQYTLGLFNFARGFPGAGAAFKRAAELNPNNPDALESYANWSWMQGRTENTEALLRRAVELDPLSLARYGTLGSFLGIETEPQKTLALVDRIEELFDDPEAFRLIGRLMELAGQVDEAIAWTIRARDVEPRNPENRHRLAELYAVIGDFETALNLEPQPGLGLLYRMRRYEELIDRAEFLMIEEPQDMPLRYLLAFAYNTTGQFEKALRVLESAGLPNSVLEETRFSADMEGFITLMNAAYGEGDAVVARELANFWINRDHPVNIDWWQDSNKACVMSVLGNDDMALESLVRLRNSPRLPWYPVLLDSTCFQHYRDESAYQGTLQHIEARQDELRKRLPATLAKFNVSL